MLNRRSVTSRTFANPRLRSTADLDRSEYRRLEFPAGGAIATARDIARAYCAFSSSAESLGLTASTLEHGSLSQAAEARMV